MTIFKKIIDKEIPAEIVHEDELCLAFRDIQPQAPVHILLIPKEEIRSLAHFEERHKDLAGHMAIVAAKIAREQGLEEKGYRVVTNIGNDGGQSVFHLHYHILGGRTLSWPPG